MAKPTINHSHLRLIIRKMRCSPNWSPPQNFPAPYMVCFHQISVLTTPSSMISSNPSKEISHTSQTYSGWWCNNHLEKYESQWEGLSHILLKIKNVWNHQPVFFHGFPWFPHDFPKPLGFFFSPSSATIHAAAAAAAVAFVAPPRPAPAAARRFGRFGRGWWAPGAPGGRRRGQPPAGDSRCCQTSCTRPGTSDGKFHESWMKVGCLGSLGHLKWLGGGKVDEIWDVLMFFRKGWWVFVMVLFLEDGFVKSDMVVRPDHWRPLKISWSMLKLALNLIYWWSYVVFYIFIFLMDVLLE